MQEVAGKVAFVTGGSSGIGLGIARAFAEAGMKVSIGYRTGQHLERALHELGGPSDRVHAVDVDVTDRAGMERAAAEVVATFGKLHVLVNNAGVVHPAPLSMTTYDDWDWVMNVNLNGVFNGVHAFLPCIRAHGEGGHIVTTASVLGLFVSGGTQAAYVASKFATVGMMESLRAELVDTEVGVSVFCPGMVTSNIMDSSRSRPRGEGTRFERDPASQERESKLRADPQLNMDPLEAGRLVLRGMRKNDLYILTHPEYEPVIRERSAALLGSFPPDLRATPERLAMARGAFSGSIYNADRERSLP